MTAEDKLLQLSNLVMWEHDRVEAAYVQMCRYRLCQERQVDALDLLELLEARVRLEYWQELAPCFLRILRGR
ncbi:MAG: hypothetical protein LBC83_01900 [Oscillospiraceae bacterium]|jgi:hypothetical protein|nr:hypothetical protein [Oscillospiraceae bacterium]